jgi:hypothetical protein
MTARLFLVSLLLAGLAAAQTGHPAKGSWSGYWGPDEANQRRMLLVLDWADNEITGTINPGRNAVEVERAELDVSNWTLTIEAEMPLERGSSRMADFVATGKLENLGSWSNRRYSGRYKFGNESGTFHLTIN